MLIYTGIFIASLMAALLVRNFYKAIAAKSRLVHVSKKPITRTDISTRYEEARAGFKTCNRIPVPTVQQSHKVALNLSKTSPAKPNVCRNRDTSWLIHEKKLATMGRSYKVRRRVEPEPLTLEMASKPYRREVASWAQNNKIAIRPWEA